MADGPMLRPAGSTPYPHGDTPVMAETLSSNGLEAENEVLRSLLQSHHVSLLHWRRVVFLSMRRFLHIGLPLPALVTLVLTVVALAPSALSLPQHGDERMYVWKAGYYGGLVARLDTRTEMRDSYKDPGWSPMSFWAFEQPLGSHWLYALALAITRTSPPSQPYSYTDPSLQGPETEIPSATLPAVRGAAVLLASLGLALIALRWKWRAVIATLLFLAIPDVRDDLARAWAEGPLLFGFGLAVVSYDTRWFILFSALAASFKLTALVLWPFAIWKGVGVRLQHAAAFVALAGTFTALHPPSWLAGGPVYMLALLQYRFRQQEALSASDGGPAGIFLPSRYIWPFELTALLVVSIAVTRFAQSHQPSLSTPVMSKWQHRRRSRNVHSDGAER